MARAARKKKSGASSVADDRLDEALRETFPASDPIAVGKATANEPAARPVDRKAPRFSRDDSAAPGRRRASG